MVIGTSSIRFSGAKAPTFDDVRRYEMEAVGGAFSSFADCYRYICLLLRLGCVTGVDDVCWVSYWGGEFSSFNLSFT